MVRTMLRQAGMENMYWAEAARTAVYIKTGRSTVAWGQHLMNKCTESPLTYLIYVFSDVLLTITFLLDQKPKTVLDVQYFLAMWIETTDLTVYWIGLLRGW